MPVHACQSLVGKSESPKATHKRHDLIFVALPIANGRQWLRFVGGVEAPNSYAVIDATGCQNRRIDGRYSEIVDSLRGVSTRFMIESAQLMPTSPCPISV